MPFEPSEIFSVPLRAAAAERALELASTIREAVGNSVQEKVPGLSQGRVGVAVLYDLTDQTYPGFGYDCLAHTAFESAIANARWAGEASMGLFHGLSGFGFGAELLSRGGRRYQRLRQQLGERITQHVEFEVERVRNSPSLCCADFDVVSGLAGMAAYLLSRHGLPGPDSHLAKTLLGLSNLILAPESPPRWHAPTDTSRRGGLPNDFGTRSLNCGLAHGIPGPLAVLSLAYLEGNHSAQIAEAIEKAAAWLMAQRLDDSWGPNWPTAVPVGGTQAETAMVARTAWCYGAPGIARALWLAGRAIRVAEYQVTGIEAMRGVFRRPRELRRLNGPTICHGTAGVLQIAMRFAEDTGDDGCVDGARSLVNEILIATSDSERVLNEYGPWLLEGAAGAAACLLSVANPARPAWDRAFLLA